MFVVPGVAGRGAVRERLSVRDGRCGENTETGDERGSSKGLTVGKLFLDGNIGQWQPLYAISLTQGKVTHSDSSNGPGLPPGERAAGRTQRLGRLRGGRPVPSRTSPFRRRR